LSVRDSLGVSAQARFARRLPYTLVFSTGLFVIITYLAFIRNDEHSDEGLKKLAEKFPALEEMVEQVESDRTAARSSSTD
jgi:hypothetical protein